MGRTSTNNNNNMPNTHHKLLVGVVANFQHNVNVENVENLMAKWRGGTCTKRHILIHKNTGSCRKNKSQIYHRITFMQCIRTVCVYMCVFDVWQKWTEKAVVNTTIRWMVGPSASNNCSSGFISIYLFGVWNKIRTIFGCVLYLFLLSFWLGILLLKLSVGHAVHT